VYIFQIGTLYLTAAHQQAAVTGEKTLIGNILNTMAIAHRLNRNFAQALLCAQQAEQIFREHHNTLELAHVWHNLGLIYGQNNQTTNANEYVIQALHLYRQLGNQYGEQKLIIDLNHVAEQLLKSSFSIRELLGDVRGLAAIQYRQAYLCFEHDDLATAEHLLQNALQLQISVNDRPKMIPMLRLLAQIAAKRQWFDMANY